MKVAKSYSKLIWVGHPDHFLAHLDILILTRESGSWSGFCGVEFDGPATMGASKGKPLCGACRDIMEMNNKEGADYVIVKQ